MGGTLLIIGNGFDLNLKLKTSYNDYFESIYFNEMLKRIGSNQNLLVNYLKQVGAISTWIDAENEIYNYYLRHRNNISRISRLRSEFNEIINSFLKYLSSIDLNKIDKSSYAYNWAKTLPPSLAVNSKPLYIINFNYTDTFNSIAINSEFVSRWGQVKNVNVHGTLLDGNIILGLSDQVELDLSVNYLRKSSFPNFGIDINEYILEKCQDVYFFGHSLGESDHNYFKTFFTSNTIGDRLHSPPKNVTIFYYGLDSYDNINNQLWSLTNNSTSKFKIRNNVKFIDLKGVK